MQAASAYVHTDDYFHAVDSLEAIARNFVPTIPAGSADLNDLAA